MNPGGPPPPGSRGLRNSGLDNFRNKRTNRDLETADFDESELDDLHVATPTEGDRRYSIGGASDDEDEKGKKPVRAANGSSSR
jgi:carboxypeptidase D